MHGMLSSMSTKPSTGSGTGKHDKFIDKRVI